MRKSPVAASELTPQHTRWILTWLLVTACVCADIAVVAEIITHKTVWPALGGVVALGLSFGQMSIVVAWVIWAHRNAMLRVAVAMCCAFAIGWILSISTTSALDFDGFVGAVLLYLVVLAIPFGVANAAGYRMSVDGVTVEQSTDSRPWQFSIWSLLSAMTAVAATLGVLRYANWLDFNFINAVMFFVILAISTLVLFFSTFSLKSTLAAATLFVVTSTIAGGLLQFTGNTAREEWPELIMLSGIHGLTVFAAAIILKVAGCQLQRVAAIKRE
ncbi:MAG: hypothetical protein CMJ64_24245 [Planctomycetaceae bacterium]|nr:hypothetical protein [Planctomycetaceae bacterium]